MSDDREAWERDAKDFVKAMGDKYGLRAAVVCAQLDDPSKPARSRIACNMPIHVALLELGRAGELTPACPHCDDRPETIN
ncbi:MAG: hypothetical protein KGL39_05095 [Patescibacteria group bacterium]|nr:hypothetical protein [Patescibacteria group bacterium]